VDTRQLRKKALKLRTIAITHPRPENSASYEAMANVYDALAKAVDHIDRVRRRRETPALADTP
jgi:hypothetical protein